MTFELLDLPPPTARVLELEVHIIHPVYVVLGMETREGLVHTRLSCILSPGA